MSEHAEIRWVEASYHAIHQVLTNPVYAGAYVYGKTRTEMMLDASGVRRKRIKHLPRDQWQVLIKEHHQAFIDWQTYEANQQRIARNTRPGPHKAGGAVREGSALLQGLAYCGHCGRRLRTHYHGRNSSPGYHCAGERLVEGRGSYCLNIGGVQIDDAATRAFLAALEPAKIRATLAAAEQSGYRFEGNRVCSLRKHRKIPCFVPKTDAAAGELLTIKRVATALGVAPSTIHRLINDGIIAGEQITPGAPWRIRLTDDLKARFNCDAGEGFLPMREAIRALGVSRQTVLQRVKRGELEAVHVTRGRQKGLRIKVIARQSELFEGAS
jgi:predicted DNA-binding transcriptional regulator AlpA